MTKLFDITGKSLSGEWGKDDNDGTGIPVLRTTNFTNEGIINYNNVVTRQINKKNIQEKYLRKGDIIIEKSGGSDNQPVGRVVFFEGEENIYLFNNFTGLLRVENQKKWHPKYVFYTLFANYLNGGTRQFENKTTGLHNLKTDSYVSSVEIREIPFEKQEKIVRNLDSVCRLIELRKQQLSKLDELVKSRFVELFGDLTSNTYGWETCTFNECFDITSSKRILKSEWKAQGIPFLRVRDMVQLATTGTMDNEFFVSEEFYASLSDSDGVPAQGDILVSATSTLGKCHVVGDGERFYFKDADVLRFRPQRAINPVFFMEQMKTDYIEEQIARTLGVTTVAHFTIKAAKTISMRCPDLGLQEMFAAFVEQTDKSKLVIQQSLDKLETMKKALMQQYFG